MTLSSTAPRGVQPVSVAILTPPGRGALAVVGVAGPGAAEVVDRVFAPRGGMALAERADGAIAFGSWLPTGEEVVVVKMATDRVEVHGHGGLAAAEAVVASLAACGCRRGHWEEWLSGGDAAREALRAFPDAVGPKAAMILARQAAGVLDGSLADLDRFARGGDGTAAHALATRLLASARVGLRLIRPWRVVFAGRVNAGKSSLMNAILGHGRSIVSPTAGTTRDVVTASAVLGGWAVELVDTAGSRTAGDPASAVERAGIARADEAREAADLVVFVIPADEPVGLRADEHAATNVLVVRSKSDLVASGVPPGELAASAVTGAGIDAVIDAIVDRLVPEERADPALLAEAVPFTPRQVEAIAAYVAASSLDLPRM